MPDDNERNGQVDPAKNVQDRPVKRERWGNRLEFIIAAVGSAVGLGNIWRFPYLMYKHGGGSFLIPYFFFLVTTGLPLLQAELALGRLFQKGDIESFGSIHKRCRGIGAISVVGGFGIVVYYSAIVAWALYFFVAAFWWPFPWATDDCGDNAECLANPDTALPLESSSNYFRYTVANVDDEAVEKGVASVISGPMVACLFFTWVASYFCVWKGVQSIGKAAKYTVFLPWCILTILIVYNSTLDGSMDGVQAYIGEWDMSTLRTSSAWTDAAGQIFFSISAGVGIMAAYASYAPATTNVWADNNWIAYINSFTSFMGGFAVFSILGNIAHRQRGIAADSAALRVNICRDTQASNADTVCPLDCGDCGLDSWASSSYSQCCGNFDTANVAEAGFMLAFSVYPASLQYLPKGGANFMALLWFGMLWLLGIDSMFAHVAALSTVITDTPRFRHVSNQVLAAVMSVIGFVASLAFASDVGLPLQDSFDHYIVSYGLFLTGALEAVAVSWIWGWKETKEKCGYRSAALVTYGFLGGTVFSIALAASLHSSTSASDTFAIGLIVGLLIFASAACLAFVLRSNRDQTLRQWLGVWVFAGTRNLRSTFQVRPKRWQQMLHIITFDVPIKYIVGPSMLVLFINQIVVDASGDDTRHSSIPTWMHGVASVLLLGIMFVSLIAFVIYPDFWDVLGVDEDAGQPIAIYDELQLAVVNDEEALAPNEQKPLFAMPDDDGWGAI